MSLPSILSLFTCCSVPQVGPFFLLEASSPTQPRYPPKPSSVPQKLLPFSLYPLVPFGVPSASRSAVGGGGGGSVPRSDRCGERARAGPPDGGPRQRHLRCPPDRRRDDGGVGVGVRGGAPPRPAGVPRRPARRAPRTPAGCGGGGGGGGGGGRLEATSLCAGGSHAISASREEPEERANQLNGELGSDITGEAAETYSRNPRTVCPSISSGLSLVSVSQSISSVASSTPLDRKLPPTTKVTDSCTVLSKVRNSSDCGTTSAVKASGGDGYNWRKYGQKQVKSPKGSRSYFRCTNSDCSAKKIECSDLLSQTTETVYRSSHNHDPPQKVRDGRQRSRVKSSRIIVESEVAKHPVRMLPESDPSVASREQKNELPSSVPGREIQEANGFDANYGIVAKQGNDNDPGLKPRGKKNRLIRSSSPLKPGKKPKFVVHAAGDVGISADGYRWRKYGQKMVKGNPYPRNYYRCTSAGCPVRKQVETAIDNASAITITYKGIHDHDRPVPKKRNGPPSVPLIAAASSDSLHSTPIKKSDGLRDHTSPTQCSVDSEGELSSQALDLGGEKAIESARTLLSIGFEIKPR